MALATIGVVAPAMALDLQGHRGARGLAPENTLPAFARALEIGVDTLELDLVVSADDVLLVGHDPQLNSALARGPDGRWLSEPAPVVFELDAAALRGFDVGRLDPASDYAARWPQQQPVDGTAMPTLAEVAELVDARGATTVRFNVETKISPRRRQLGPAPERFAELVVAELRRLDLAARATVQSFDWRTLRRVQELAPEIPTVCLTARQRWLDNVADPAWTAGLQLADHEGSVPQLVAAAGCRIWSPFHGDLTPLDLRRAENLGLMVVVWTVNEPADMRRLIGQGVHGLITDYPDRARAVMAEIGIPLPPSFP
jgi:glycerophosphoryl diester phosphodiesterase